MSKHNNNAIRFSREKTRRKSRCILRILPRAYPAGALLGQATAMPSPICPRPLASVAQAAFLLSSGLAMLEVLTSLKDRLADAQARIADLRERL